MCGGPRRGPRTARRSVFFFFLKPLAPLPSLGIPLVGPSQHFPLAARSCERMKGGGGVCVPWRKGGCEADTEAEREGEERGRGQHVEQEIFCETFGRGARHRWEAGWPTGDARNARKSRALRSTSPPPRPPQYSTGAASAVSSSGFAHRPHRRCSPQARTGGGERPRRTPCHVCLPPFFHPGTLKKTEKKTPVSCAQTNKSMPPIP